MVIETVGVGQSETEVAEAADTVAVVVQPGSGDALQFLKAGIMEVPDVLVVTKADLGAVAARAQRDLAAALQSLGESRVPVVAVSSITPVSGFDDLVGALDAHRARLDLPAVRMRARRLGALADFVSEHGERGLRALGGRRAAATLARRAGSGLGRARADAGARSPRWVTPTLAASTQTTTVRREFGSFPRRTGAPPAGGPWHHAEHEHDRERDPAESLDRRTTR